MPKVTHQGHYNVLIIYINGSRSHYYLYDLLIENTHKGQCHAQRFHMKVTLVLLITLVNWLGRGMKHLWSSNLVPWNFSKASIKSGLWKFKQEGLGIIVQLMQDYNKTKSDCKESRIYFLCIVNSMSAQVNLCFVIKLFGKTNEVLRVDE